MKILAIDTSCDETSVAVTEGTQILSNVVWSQAKLHEKYGGVMPSEAKRAHEERIGLVVDEAIRKTQCSIDNIGAVAVTAGPGLAIALEVGIRKARELAKEWGKPLIAVNHIEGHLVSPLARNFQFSISNFQSMTNGQMLNEKISFPALALVVSGGHTELIYVEKIGKYEIVARTQDDALGEALDKAARMLGLSYPGGAELEKRAQKGNPKAYSLPLPMAGREDLNAFSYSGLKTAFWRLVSQLSVNQLTSKQVSNLAAGFQDMAFKHLIRVTRESVRAGEWKSVRNLLVGGGVAANKELRMRLSDLGDETGLKVWFPPEGMGLYGDNAAMIGIAAGFKAQRGEFVKDIEKVDREPRARIDEPFAF